jgi:hypothetical protein
VTIIKMKRWTTSKTTTTITTSTIGNTDASQNSDSH